MPVMNTIPHSLTPRQRLYLQRLTQSKIRLLAAIDGLDQQTLCHTPALGDWTIKDILGHLVAWNDEFRREIQLILQGEHPGYQYQISGADSFAASNQLWIDARRTWTWAQMRADLERDYQAEFQLIQSLSPADFRQRGVTPWKRAAFQPPASLTRADTESVETLVTFHWRHINQHVRWILRWRRSH